MREPLRDVNVDGYRLETWDAGRSDNLGKSILAYKFSGLDGKVLFEGEDFACSPLHAIDSDESLRALLSFLTLKPGDTDRDYFADYTPEQMAFAEGDAEQLQLWVMWPDDNFELPAFEDWWLWKVTVGNIGTVYSGHYEADARAEAEEYREMAGMHNLRPSFPVVLWLDGEPLVEYHCPTSCGCEDN